MKFVNYKKRSIALPPGCKDLIDVLRPPKARKAHPLSAWPYTHRDGEATGRLSEVKKYADMLFGSEASFFTLYITSADDQVTVDAMRAEGGVLRAGLYVQQNTTQESAVRTFFTNHGLTLPQDAPTPFDWVPDAPVFRRYEFSPMPQDAVRFTGLVIEIFRDVFGLTTESQLHFRHDEVL